MRGGLIVREARQRVGLTQAELAQRARTTQSAIARLETGATEPSLWHVAELVSACGLHLGIRLIQADPEEVDAARRNLQLTPDERVRKMLAAQRFVAAGRAAKKQKQKHRGNA